jgi:hypothetical protein
MRFVCRGGVLPVRDGRRVIPDADGPSPDEASRVVDVDAFWIGRTEVTVEQYTPCVEAGACASPVTGPQCNWGIAGRSSYPVHCVRFTDARAYSEWLASRLPCGFEWRFAVQQRRVAGSGRNRQPRRPVWRRPHRPRPGTEPVRGSLLCGCRPHGDLRSVRERVGVGLGRTRGDQVQASSGRVRHRRICRGDRRRGAGLGQWWQLAHPSLGGGPRPSGLDARLRFC